MGIKSKSNNHLKSFFFKALCIALGIHILGGIMFSIPPYEFKSQSAQSPILVSSSFKVTDSNPLQTQLLTDYHASKTPFPENLIAFQPSLPPLLNEESELSFLENSNFLENEDKSDSFNHTKLNLNDLDLKDVAIYLPISNELKHKPFQIHISGNLASKPLKNIELLNTTDLEIDSKHPLTEIQIIYSVQLEEKTGRIFHINIDKSSGFNWIDILGEQFLKKLEFKENIEGFISSGTVEITLLLNRNFFHL